MEGGWRRLCVRLVSAVMPEWVFSLRVHFSPQPDWYVAGRAERGCLHKDSVILKLGSLDLVDGTPVWISNRISPLLNRFPMPVPASAKCASGRNGGLFYRRGRKALLTLEKRYPQLTLFIREVLARTRARPIVKVRKRAKPMPSAA